MKSIDSVVVIVNDWVYIIDGQMIFIFRIIIRICLFFLARLIRIDMKTSLG